MQYRTKELCELLGMGSKALRLYEEMGLIHPARESENGYRLFTQNDLLRILEIKKYQEESDSLQAVVQMLNAESVEDVLDNLQRQIDEVEAQLEALTQKRRHLQAAYQSRRRNIERQGQTFELEFGTGDLFLPLDSDEAIADPAETTRIYRQWAQHYSQLNLMVIVDIMRRQENGFLGWQIGVVNKSKPAQTAQTRRICSEIPGGTALCREVTLTDISRIRTEDMRPLLEMFAVRGREMPRRVYLHHDLTLNQTAGTKIDFLAMAFLESKRTPSRTIEKESP